MKDIGTRIATGIIFIAVIVGCIIWNEYSFLAIFALIIGLCIREYHNIIDLKLGGHRTWRRASKYINVTFGVSILVLFYLVSKGLFGLTLLSLIMLYPLTWFIIEMFGLSDTPFVNVTFNATAIFYLAIPMSSANFIVFDNGTYHFSYILAIFLFVLVK